MNSCHTRSLIGFHKCLVFAHLDLFIIFQPEMSRQISMTEAYLMVVFITQNCKTQLLEAELHKNTERTLETSVEIGRN